MNTQQIELPRLDEKVARQRQLQGVCPCCANSDHAELTDRYRLVLLDGRVVLCRDQESCKARRIRSTWRIVDGGKSKHP